MGIGLRFLGHPFGLYRLEPAGQAAALAWWARARLPANWRGQSRSRGPLRRKVKVVGKSAADFWFRRDG